MDDQSLFESAWFKWSWAVAHSKMLEAHVKERVTQLDTKPHIALGKRYDPKHHRIDVFIAEIDDLPPEWGLVLGDIAHNYRSCLDHIAWALVERGRTPLTTLSERARNGILLPR